MCKLPVKWVLLLPQHLQHRQHHIVGQHHQPKFTHTRIALELDSLRIQPELRNEKAEHGAHCCILVQQLTERCQLLNCLYSQSTCSFGAHGDDGILNNG